MKIKSAQTVCYCYPNHVGYVRGKCRMVTMLYIAINLISTDSLY